MEILWRWVFGIPALLVILAESQRIFAVHPVNIAALQNISLLDPVTAAAILQQTLFPLIAPVERAALVVAPVLAIVWVVVSAIGRTAVLRRTDPGLHRAILPVAVLHALRLVALAATFAAWYLCLRWNAQYTVNEPIVKGEEPSVVLYCSIVIVATLALFTAWAVISWIFAAAPLLAMRRGLSAWSSIAAAMKIGPLKSKLIEVNLVMGIVKIALIVLAMVLSACPLPFESAATPEFMAWWYGFTAVVYLVASDFFHVVHLVSYLDLWAAYEPGTGADLGRL